MRKEKKKLLHITARHRTRLKTVDLFYYSTKQAAYFNPGLKDFRIVELKSRAGL